MKKPRKKLIIFLVIFLICAGLLTFFAIYYRPLPVAIYSESTVMAVRRFNEETRRLENMYPTQIVNMPNGEIHTIESILDPADLEQIIEILSRYTFVRLRYDSPPWFRDGDIQWEIMLGRRHHPIRWEMVTISFGNTDFMSRNRRSHRIQNVELLIEELRPIFES